MGLPSVALSEIAHPVARPTVVTPGTLYRTIGVKWWGEGAYERQTVDGAQVAARTLSFVRKDDLIINKIWVRHGSIAVASDSVDGCAASGEFPTFALDTSRVLPRWIHWLSKSHGFWEKCESLSHGTSGKNRIKPERFLTIDVPLPSLAEQRRIVARVEDAAAKIEEARGLRRQAEEETEALLSSVAARVFESLAVAPSLSIEAIAEVRGGIQKGPHRVAGSSPARYLTVAHVQRDHIRLSDPRFFEVSGEELARWRLEPGDVLIVEGNGSANEIGRTALFRGEIEDCVHQNHIIRIRPNRERSDPEFVNAYLNSPLGKEEVQARSRTTSGLRSLSVGRIKQISVPVPPLAEQLRAVAYLSDLRARLSALRGLQTQTAAEMGAVLPAVLDKAFRGQM